MINGLFETHIKVSDLERSMQFYGEALGLELGHLVPERRIAFYWLGGRGKAMLGVWEAPKSEEGIQRQHFAFSSTLEQVLAAPDGLRERGIQGRNFLDELDGEPLVLGWMPGLSYYFRDPDGHSLEFIAMLGGPPAPELNMATFDQWQRAQQGVSA